MYTQISSSRTAANSLVANDRRQFDQCSQIALLSVVACVIGLAVGRCTSSLAIMEPPVIKFAYENYEKQVTAGKVKTSAKCKQCTKTIRDTGTTTTNYRRHLRSLHDGM